MTRRGSVPHERTRTLERLSRSPLIAMVHVGALPGSPYASQNPSDIMEQALREARELVALGFDALILENMHDRPYVATSCDPVVVACMAQVSAAVRAAHPELLLGVQILAARNLEALAVAHATGAQFIRAENFVYAHVADEGWMPTASAGELLRYRKAIGAEQVAVVCDLQKKHAAHAMTADVELRDWVHGAEFFGADGVIVTGRETGHAADGRDVEQVSRVASVPVLVGSGVTPQNVRGYLDQGVGVIVGSWLKRDGHWASELDPDRARAFLTSARSSAEPE